MADTAIVRSPWSREGDVLRGGGRIHFAEVGSGPAVVLLPKLGGWIADWRHVAPLLADHHRVIALDPPGHGQSTMLGPPPEFQTVGESAAMIKAALEELGVDRFDLAGVSLGGCIGLVMAAFWPAAVGRLALVSTALAEASTRAHALATEATRSGVYDQEGRPLPITLNDADQRFGIVRVETYYEHLAGRVTAGPWVRASERGVAIAGITDYLPRIEAPTLLVYGSEGVYYHKYRALGESRIRTVHVEMIADSGSFTQQDNPEATAAVLSRFFSA